MSISHVVAFVAGMAAGAAALAQAPANLAAATPWPARPVTLVVSDSAGSAADAVARVLAPRLATALAQPVSVDSRAGEAAQAVARAAPDGYTLLLAGPTVAIDAAVRPPPQPDPQKDLAAVSLVATFPYVLIATTTVALDSVQDIVAIAKASPGRLSYASPGAGSGAHLAGELFKSATSVHLRHAPLKTQTAALAEVAAGRAQLAFVPLAAAEPLLKARTARAVAVTGPARIAMLPDVPTMREAGVPGFDLVGWLGVLAPAGTAKSIVDRLNAEVRKAVQVPEVRERIAALVSGDATGSSQDAFRDLLKREVSGWSRLAREMSIRVE